MQTFISTFSLTLYFVLLLLSMTLLALPGDYWPWYLITAFVALVPIAVGPTGCRIAGSVALTLSLILIINDFSAGQAWDKNRLEDEAAGNLRENAEPRPIQELE